jgi:CheY-like chemotaxis protein
VSSSQNLRAVTEGEEGEAPESQRRPGVQATLSSLLELAYGSRDGAVGAMARALAVAELDALPDATDEVLVFVLGPLFSVLNAELGPTLTKALVEDFTTRFDREPDSEPPKPASSAPPRSVPRAVARVSLRPRSSPPAPPERRVLLVDTDRVGRALLARSLMRMRWGVSVVDSIADLAEALADAPPDALLVDVNHAAATEMVQALVAAAPRALVVVRGPDGAKARALLAAAGPIRAEVCPRESSAEEIIEAVKRAVEG